MIFEKIDSCCCDEPCELVEKLACHKSACIFPLEFPVDFPAGLRKSHPVLLRSSGPANPFHRSSAFFPRLSHIFFTQSLDNHSSFGTSKPLALSRRSFCCDDTATRLVRSALDCDRPGPRHEILPRGCGPRIRNQIRRPRSSLLLDWRARAVDARALGRGARTTTNEPPRGVQDKTGRIARVSKAVAGRQRPGTGLQLKSNGGSRCDRLDAGRLRVFS